MQKSSNRKNGTLISTAMKCLGAESLTLTIKKVQNPTSWLPMLKSLTSKNLSLKTRRWKFSLNNLSAKSLTIKILHKNHEAESRRAEKKSHENLLLKLRRIEERQKVLCRKLVVQKYDAQKLLEFLTTKIMVAKSFSESIWFQKK